MNLTSTLKKIAIIFEHPRSRAAGLIVRELVGSSPASRGNALSKASTELVDVEDRKSFRVVIAVIVGLYQASKGLAPRPSANAVEDAASRVVALLPKAIAVQRSIEDSAILARHADIDAGTLSYGELLRIVLGAESYSKTEYDAFKSRCKRLFEREGIAVRSQKAGRKKKKETIKETLKRLKK